MQSRIDLATARLRMMVSLKHVSSEHMWRFGMILLHYAKLSLADPLSKVWELVESNCHENSANARLNLKKDKQFLGIPV